MASDLQTDSDAPVAPGGDDTKRWWLQHQRWLRAIVMARVGERQAVDDVMQEVALAATVGRSGLRDPSRIAPWLYRVAVRQALLYRRKQGRHRNKIEQFAQRRESPDASSGDPLTWLLDREQSRQVRAALEALAARDREILLLKYSENWSYRQIAEHLGTSATAIEARLHRARHKLRKQLLARNVGKDQTRDEDQ